MNEVDYTQGEAKEFLDDVLKACSATLGDFKGKRGYFVSGQLRNYFVEESTADVFNADTGQYISVVGKGGHHLDNRALPSILIGLKHDNITKETVTTLR